MTINNAQIDTGTDPKTDKQAPQKAGLKILKSFTKKIERLEKAKAKYLAVTIELSSQLTSTAVKPTPTSEIIDARYYKALTGFQKARAKIEMLQRGQRMRILRVTSVRTPFGVANGYEDIVGQILPFTGNAYYGFTIKLDSGEVRDLMHYASQSVLSD